MPLNPVFNELLITDFTNLYSTLSIDLVCKNEGKHLIINLASAETTSHSRKQRSVYNESCGKE